MNIGNTRVNLYPERRARKVEDLHVPGAYVADLPAEPQPPPQPELPLSSFVTASSRNVPQAHLRVTLESGFLNRKVNWRAQRAQPGNTRRSTLQAIMAGATIGLAYMPTLGLNMHEVLGHGIIGQNAVIKSAGPLQYWTDAVQSAAKANLTEVPADSRYWQSDWTDAMALHGVLVGTGKQLLNIRGHIAAPNDTAWSWNDLDDASLQVVLQHFTQNKTDRFAGSLGFVDPVFLDAFERTNLGERLGARGMRVWVNLAGSVPGFALVSATWAAATHLENNHPMAALVASQFGTVLHGANVGGMLGDVGGAARATTDHILGQAMTAAMLMYLAALLPYAINAASRARRGVMQSLVSDEHAMRTYILRAAKDPATAARLSTLLASYPGRSFFHAQTDVESKAFTRQLMDCYGYLQDNLKDELDSIKRTQRAQWLANPKSQSFREGFDAASAVLKGIQVLLSVTSAVSLAQTPGAPLSGHVALALPTVVLSALAQQLMEATKWQAVRDHEGDPASLYARFERVFE